MPVRPALSITDTRDLGEVGVSERLGSRLPLELEFTASDGRTVKLGDVFDGKKPVVLSLVYYRCPRVCSFLLEGMLDAFRDLEALTLGKDYRVVSVSINPKETPQDAGRKSDRLFSALGSSSREGWWFLTGSEVNIKVLADAVGFRYRADGDEYAHPTAIVVLTPDGEVSRYLYGIDYKPFDLRVALLEASKGEVGEANLVNHILLYCYKFDPVGRRYALSALNILKGCGIITVLGVGTMVAFLIISDKKERRGFKEKS